MQSRKINITFGLAGILILLLACNFGAASEETSPASSGEDLTTAEQPGIPAADGPCHNELYPVIQSASWTYSNSGGPFGAFTYTDTITQIRADGFTLTSQFPDLVRTQEWACESEGLKALQFGGGPTANISTQGVNADFKTLEVNGISLPRTITPAMQWQYTLKMEGVAAMPGNQNALSEGTFSSAMQELGRETISVPAGTFEAIKFQFNNTVKITTDFQGLQVPIEFSGNGFVWYVPGIGHVKSIENSSFGDEPSTYITELQSYNIP